MIDFSCWACCQQTLKQKGDKVTNIKKAKAIYTFSSNHEFLILTDFSKTQSNEEWFQDILWLPEIWIMQNRSLADITRRPIADCVCKEYKEFHQKPFFRTLVVTHCSCLVLFSPSSLRDYIFNFYFNWLYYWHRYCFAHCTFCCNLL